MLTILFNLRPQIQTVLIGIPASNIQKNKSRTKFNKNVEISIKILIRQFAQRIHRKGRLYIEC